MAYPTTIDSFTTKVDHTDIVAAAHINAAQTAIVNIESTLGYGATAPTANSTASTIMLRNSDGVAYGNHYYVLAYGTVATSCNDGTYTPIVFSTVRSQVGTLWTVANPTKFYAYVTGLYLVVANIAFVYDSGHQTGQRACAIRQGGSVYRAAGSNNAVVGTTHNVSPVSQVLYLTAGDYVEVMGYQTCGVALDAQIQTNITPEFQMVLL